jgi:hypothetical protein
MLRKNPDFNLEAEVCINYSQSLNRSPWSVGPTLVSTPSTKSRFLYGLKLLNVKTMFQLMGWEPTELVLPTSLSMTNSFELVGNMMAIPVVGAIEVVFLSALFQRAPLPH